MVSTAPHGFTVAPRKPKFIIKPINSTLRPVSCRNGQEPEPLRLAGGPNRPLGPDNHGFSSAWPAQAVLSCANRSLALAWAGTLWQEPPRLVAGHRPDSIATPFAAVAQW